MSGSSHLPAARPSVAFWVYGCRLNQAEAAAWQAALAEQGFPAAPKESAEVVCVHSCAVTEPAAHEVLKALRAFRTRRPGVKIILSGCAAKLLPPGVADLCLPHERKSEWVAAVLAFLGASGAAPAPVFLPRLKTRASLVVQDGCDQFCAYCIVPHLRGAPVSEPLPALLKRAEVLFAAGYREITLTGCHLALYRDPVSGADFTELLRRLCDVRGEGRFRISSVEPCILNDADWIRLIAASGGRLCAFLHLPVQTVSDALLRRMGRRYTAADLHRVFDFIGETLPLCGLSADWIAGLPGETEADAAASQAFLSAYPFTGAHIFPYSRRPGTPAAAFPNQVPQHLIHARAAQLTHAAEETRRRVLPRFLNRPLTVIPERMRGGAWEGWSAERLRCRLTGAAERGKPMVFHPTRIEGECLC